MRVDRQRCVANKTRLQPPEYPLKNIILPPLAERHMGRGIIRRGLVMAGRLKPVGMPHWAR